MTHSIVVFITVVTNIFGKCTHNYYVICKSFNSYFQLRSKDSLTVFPMLTSLLAK